MTNHYYHQCSECSGAGEIEWTRSADPRTVVSRETCEACEGRGIQATIEGQELLDFLEKMVGIGPGHALATITEKGKKG